MPNNALAQPPMQAQITLAAPRRNAAAQMAVYFRQFEAMPLRQNNAPQDQLRSRRKRWNAALTQIND